MCRYTIIGKELHLKLTSIGLENYEFQTIILKRSKNTLVLKR